ncbi:hypothetical protein LTR86_001699 [Recurvomyces mirabilis]|nr:hypothetical protein LTR86_001699 [Recurvomyces mirabilis]
MCPGWRARIRRRFEKRVHVGDFEKKGLARSVVKIALPIQPILSDNVWRGKVQWVPIDELEDWDIEHEIVDCRPLVWFVRTDVDWAEMAGGGLWDLTTQIKLLQYSTNGVIVTLSSASNA